LPAWIQHCEQPGRREPKSGTERKGRC
jgi:hypothetical protein